MARWDRKEMCGGGEGEGRRIENRVRLTGIWSEAVAEGLWSVVSHPWSMLSARCWLLAASCSPLYGPSPIPPGPCRGL
jgi:hypothetical protein